LSDDLLSNLSSWITEPPKKIKPKPKREPEPITDFEPEIVDVPETKKIPALPKIAADPAEKFDLDKILEDEAGTDPAEIAERTEIAEMVIKEQKALQESLTTATRRADLMRRGLFKEHVAPFLDRAYGDIKRLSNSFLSDIGGEIVENGGVTPEIRAKFEDAVSERWDTAKKEQMKILKEISKEQAVK